MEAYTYSSSYPDSGDSSPRSREIDCDTAAAWDELPPPSSRVKLMCSYGGRIQPRSHDNQLSYVGGDTKILTVDRSVRFPLLLAKLTALSASDDVILKYQLPGEDLDALISVTNDEDLEHMMIEYDRLHRIALKPVPRLRLFLFPSMGKLIGGRDQGWGYADVTPAIVTSSAAKGGADFLFEPEKSAVLPPPPVPVATPSEAEPVVSPKEMQKQAQDLQKLQIAENNQTNQREALFVPRIGSDEALARVYPPDYYVHQPQEKAPPAPVPAPAAVPPTYWQDQQLNMAPAARFASIVGGDQQFYLVPANLGVFQSNAAPGQGYYTTMQRMVPAAYDSAVYSMAPPPPQAKAAYDNGGRVQAVDGSAGYGAAPAGAYDNNGGGYAYDSAGRAVFYAGTAPTYQTVSNVAIAATESKILKPSQVS